MVDPVLSALKVAAVSGIFMIWYNFTIEAFKFSWHIISSSPKKETWEAPSFKVVCGICQQLYEDDEYHVIHDVHLCEACRLKK